MSPPINIDGSTVDAITIDGSSVNEVTVDGEAVFSAIPDASVWDTEEDSAKFYEENATVAVNDISVRVDNDGDQALVDASLDRDAYVDTQDVSDVTTPITLSDPGGSADVIFRWSVVSGRYKAEHESEPGGSDTDMRTAVMILGPWNISSSDTLHYQIESEGSVTAGCSIAICDPGATTADASDVVDGNPASADATLDISGLSGDKEVVVGSSGETSVSVFGRNTEIYFS